MRSLVTSAIALVPVDCACDSALRRLSGQAAAAKVKLYFAAASEEAPQLGGLVDQDSGGVAVRRRPTTRTCSATRTARPA